MTRFEIKTREIITEADMIKTFQLVCKKYGFTITGNNLGADTKYARVSMYEEYVEMNNETIYKKVWFECGIKFMGNLTIEEMQNAANDIKAAAVIVQYMNDKLSDTIVSRNFKSVLRM